MNRIGAVMLGASALMVATVASGRAESSAVTSASEATTSRLAPTGGIPEKTPLFTIGGVGVYLWAPVEPPYNANSNRNGAADPLWEAGMPTAESGF